LKAGNFMMICEKEKLLEKEKAEPSGEAFRLLIQELLSYNEALKRQFYQIDNSHIATRQ